MGHDTVVGLDVHATSITAAILPPQSEHVEVVQLSGDLMQVRKLFRRRCERGPVRSCHEASGAGFYPAARPYPGRILLRSDCTITYPEEAW